jgi:hypothetical protein
MRRYEVHPGDESQIVLEADEEALVVAKGATVNISYQGKEPEDTAVQMVSSSPSMEFEEPDHTAVEIIGRSLPIDTKDIESIIGRRLPIDPKEATLIAEEIRQQTTENLTTEGLIHGYTLDSDSNTALFKWNLERAKFRGMDFERGSDIGRSSGMES